MQQFSHSRCLERLDRYLQRERYSRKVRECYRGPTKRFLVFLASRDRTLDSLLPSDVESYLASLQMVKKRRGPATPALHRSHRAAIHKLMRVVRGQWPPRAIPRDRRERSRLRIIDGYERWMHDRLGLADATALQG